MPYFTLRNAVYLLVLLAILWYVFTNQTEVSGTIERLKDWMLG